MKKSRAVRRNIKRKTKGFGVDENILKFFPKASTMGYSKPSRWTKESTAVCPPTPPAISQYPSLS